MMYDIGQRVEIAPHFDLWMRGARYGTIEGYMRKGRYQARNGAALLTPIAKVRLDKLPAKQIKFFVTDLTAV